MVSRSFGILLIFVAGNFMSYETIIHYMITIPVVFLAVFVFFPESPQYLMRIDEPKKVEHSLEVYRNCRQESLLKSAFYRDELQKLKTNCRIDMMPTDVKSMPDKLTFSDFGESFCVVVYVH